MTLYRGDIDRDNKQEVFMRVYNGLKDRRGSRQYIIDMPSVTKAGLDLMFNGSYGKIDGKKTFVKPLVDSRNRLIMIENGGCQPLIDGNDYTNILTEGNNVPLPYRKMCFVCDTKLWCDKHDWTPGKDYKGARGRKKDYFNSQIYFHLNDFGSLDLRRVIHLLGAQKVGLVMADFCGNFNKSFLDWVFHHLNCFADDAEFVCTFSLTGQKRNEDGLVELLKIGEDTDLLAKAYRNQSFQFNSDYCSRNSRRTLMYTEEANKIFSILSRCGFNLGDGYIYDTSRTSNVMLCFSMRLPSVAPSVWTYDKFNFDGKHQQINCVKKSHSFFDIFERHKFDDKSSVADVIGFSSCDEMTSFFVNHISFTNKKKINQFDERKSHAIKKGLRNLKDVTLENLYFGYKHFEYLLKSRKDGECNRRLFNGISDDKYIPLRKLLYCTGHYFRKMNPTLSIDLCPFSEFAEYDRVASIKPYIPIVREIYNRRAMINNHFLDIKPFSEEENAKTIYVKRKQDLGIELDDSTKNTRTIYVRFKHKDEEIDLFSK